MSTAHDWKRIDLDWYKCAACGNQISALADYALTKYGCKGMPGTGGPVPPLSAKEKLTSLTRQDWEMIGLKATVAQQAQMIEHLRGGPTPLYTAVDMANAAADGFRDGAASAEALRKALTECTASLEGEVLQKYHGQIPEDMHPVTRRDYDRDMAEINGYKALSKEG